MINYSESFIDFLKSSRSKIAKTLYRAYVDEHPSYRLMLTSEQIDYLAIRPDGNISYLPAGREMELTEYGDWSTEKRQDGKPGKVVRKLFTKKALKLFKDRDFETFANSFKSRYSEHLLFAIYENCDIPSVYNMKRANGQGSLDSSCMNDDGQFMDIYKFCPAVRILVLLDEEGRLCGRSLIWSLDNSITLMDRIYVAEDFMYELFIAYAVKNKWWYKKDYKSFMKKDLFIDDKGQEVNRQFTVYTNTTFQYYPYIDTFTYGDKGSLNNFCVGRYTYENSSGSREGELYDAITSRRLDPDDAIEITRGRYEGRTTHIEHTLALDSGIWWDQDPMILWIDGSPHLYVDAVWSDYDQRYYLKADCVMSDILESYILRSQAVTKDGHIYHNNAVPELKTA